MAENDHEDQRPFHETIVDAILKAENSDQLRALIGLVKSTKIPTGHLAISVAIQSSMDYFYADLYTLKEEAVELRRALVEDAQPEATTPDS